MGVGGRRSLGFVKISARSPERQNMDRTPPRQVRSDPMPTTDKASEEARGPGEGEGRRGRPPAPVHPCSLLTPASPSPCFSSSCSMLVVPGAVESNWPPPQGADVVWSKSAGRLLMGDLGPEENRAPSTEYLAPSTEHQEVPTDSSLPHGSPSLTWKRGSPGGRSRDTGSCNLLGLALGRKERARIRGEGDSVPHPPVGAASGTSTRTPFFSTQL